MASLSSRPAKPLFHVSGFCAAAIFVYLSWQSRQDLPIEFAIFGLLCALAFVVSLLGAWAAHCAGGKVRLSHVLFWCFVLRAIAVIGEPVYEDDYYRYLWDGRATVEAGNPYAEPPSAAFGDDHSPHWDDVLDNINNPDIRTVYGPVNQYFFALGYLIAPGQVWVLQAMFAGLDLLVVWLLTRMTTLAPVVLYGFSPLIIKEFSMTAHPDVISICALLVASLAWLRSRPKLTAAALAVAVASKLFAFLLVPLLLRFCWRGWGLFAIVLAVLHLPLLDPHGTREALVAMANYWVFNAPFYYLFYGIIGLKWLKIVLFVIFCWICAYYFFKSDYHQIATRQIATSQAATRQIPRADVLYMAMLLALPVFNPWYYGFVLAYAAIHPSLWAWTGSITVLLAYATGLQLRSVTLEPYEQPSWALIAEFTPILCAAVVPFVVSRLRRTRS